MMFCRPVPVNVDVSLVTKRGRLRPTAAGRHNQFPMNIFLELICDNIDLIEQLAILRRCAFARFVVGLRRPYLCLLLLYAAHYYLDLDLEALFSSWCLLCWWALV